VNVAGKQTEAPKWVAHALNGSSVRRPQRIQQLMEGDLVAGTVLEITEIANGSSGTFPLITLRVEHAIIAGEQVDAGEWVALPCELRVLRNFCQLEQPKPGDKVAVQYREKRGRAMADVVAGVVRGEGGEQAPW
jgi:hypothetical protein